MTKDVGTQTDNTLFELLVHDHSLYHTDHCKNIILESKFLEYSIQMNNFEIKNPGILNIDPRVKKRNVLFKYYCSRIKK